MGTVFSFRVEAPGVPADVLARAVRKLHAVDAAFSTYRADSEISRLNAGTLAPDALSSDVRAVLRECERLEDLTDGYFSARPDGRILDPSGYVKGWAIQGSADELATAGSLNHYVNGGGDVVCAGRPEPGRGWRIGISDPHERGRLLRTIEAAGPLAVATYGTAERGAHIFDPHTGRPATELASVTIVAHDLVTADVYATAAVAMGAERAEAWLSEQSCIQALLVRADGRHSSIGAS
jgi:thiamine biosynthesis lipoprotein